MFQNNAEKLLESHLKFAHPIAGGSNNDNKPEKFPSNSSLPVAPRTFVPRAMGGSQIDKTEIQLLQLIIMDRI